MNVPQRVEFREVTKRYGSRVILDQVSVAFSPGAIAALIGPSGGGKSTLLRCINGLTQFESGEVVVGSETLTPASSAERIAAVRRQFGMIFQNFQLFPHLTAIQNVMEAPVRVLREPVEAARERARQLLDRIGLGHRLEAYPKQLSGGQQQRVAIARALAMNPRGLLCDEITSALDPELKGEVLEVITSLKQEGLTVIMVTHEIHFARRAADHVVVLADGGIVEQGPPGQVIDQPQVPRTQQFLSQVLA